MKIFQNKYDSLSAFLFLASVVMMILAIAQSHGSGNMEKMASSMSRSLDRRVHLLDTYMQRALESNPTEWLDLGDVPEDLVVYRYCDDTLQSWANEFPLANDNIKTQVYVPVLANPRAYIVSPLADIGDTVEYVNMGYRWYLVKSVTSGKCRVFGGVEVMKEYGSQVDPNPVLHMKSGYAISPIAGGEGVAVYVEGTPVFQLSYESSAASRYQRNSFMMWGALGLLLLAGFAFLMGRHSMRRMVITLVVLVAAMSSFYFWGRSLQTQFTIFSPLLYADGDVLYSLGAVIIINLAILLLILCLFLTRGEICGLAEKRGWSGRILLLAGISVLAVLLYVHLTLKSIVENSGITLDLFKISDIDFFSLLVYVSFITLLLGIPVLIQTVRPLLRKVLRHNFNVFSLWNRFLYSLLVAMYLVTASTVLGFRKEQSRMELLAGRLSFDRDIFLELRLRSVESEIADDMIIPALSVFNNTAASIQSRIVETYLSRIERDYVVSVYVFNNENNTRASQEQYNRILRDAVPISPNSRFMYVNRDGEQPYYVGLFMYMVEGSGISRVLVCLESKEVSGSTGYAGIFGISTPGRVTLPHGVSYARYKGEVLASSHGRYAYPTRLQPYLVDRIFTRGDKTMNLDGYTHFITVIADDEVVVISRTQTTPIVFVMTVVFVGIVVFALMSLMCLRRNAIRRFMNSYYRSRILGVMMISLLLTLVAMASVSVYFVNLRNEGNLNTMMSDKINSISAMMDAGTDGIYSTEEFNLIELRRLLEQVGSDTDSDISLFTPEGMLMVSTTPMVFERQLMGERIDAGAYEQIIYKHKRYYIQREKMEGVKFYSMYAPVMSTDGSLLAIICSPYNEEDYDFEKDAVTHSMTIVALFIFFLTVALFTVSRMVDTMFRPLDEMSRKMSNVDLESPEYIYYDRKDEVSSIVQSYNRMVKELSDSSRKLAMAERDKAWNEMARQVAHEIKTPLTPMKLQIQRIIRLKEKGDPSWEACFDQASKVLLYHIDILTDTANEFSTFAKLYTEEFTEIPLDATIEQEMAMFDNKDNIKFTYMGFEGVKVRGPRPQLTRVFVNIMVNAVQAIGEKPDGQIVVSVRNSVRDGYYDIVFEDNGPGVSEENASKLFSPNFTTKNGGSGLGLAICRSVLETCGATISYQRSFSLGGACFTISYPKPDGAAATSAGSRSERDSRSS